MDKISSGRSEGAVQCFNNGFNCSQAVLASYCEKLGLERDTALKIACAFGGGMGHIGETCGAVTGAFMIIGLKYGKFKAEDKDSKDTTYRYVQKYTDAFKRAHGSVRCKDLLSYDISKESELAKAREAGVFSTICPRLVKESVEILEGLIEDL